jgi:hypothetical protein
METHAALVEPVGEKDEYVCYFTTQVFSTFFKFMFSF